MADQRTMAQFLQAATEGYEDAITADNFELKHAIIEGKSKVRYSCNKPVVAKVSTNTSTFGISPDVAELKDMVKALLLEKKSQNQASATVKAVEESYVTCGGAHSYRNCPATNVNVYRDNIQEFVSQASAVKYNQGNTSYHIKGQNQSLAPVKAVKESCVTCGGAHSYCNCPATDGNNYRENIQEFVSQASAVNYNQGNTSYRPSMMSNQIRPPSFPPAPAYQAPAPQTQGVSKENFSAYVKANDAVMKNMQTQGQNMQYQLINLTDLITMFVNSNSVYTSSLCTLPSNTIANPKSDLKTITTRSGVSYDGPQIPHPPSSLPKVVKNEPEEVLGFSDVITSGNPTPYYDLIISTTSPTLTPFENSDFFLEEVDAFLAIEDDHTLSEVDQSYLDSEGGILLLEAFLNDDPSLPPLNQGNYLPEVELKYLPPHLEYAFLEGDDKLPVVIAKDLSMEEKTALITVLKSHKRAIAWKLSDIKVLGQRQDKYFRPIHYASKSMTEAESNYTTTEKEMLAEFTFKVVDTKGAENFVVDHLSRLENSHQNVLDPKEINESFPLETLNLVSTRGNQSTSWFADFANYHAGNFIVKGVSSQQKSKFF
nr:reverse transcriptase domain-containing protein [Tanacetum cinerariifolium]